MVAQDGRVDTQTRCTCAVGRRCQQRGCHVLGGPERLGYVRWVRGVTICDDCDAVADSPPREGRDHR
jgi:hypothetical protein